MSMYKVVGVSRKIESDKNVYCRSVCKIAHWAEFENRPFCTLWARLPNGVCPIFPLIIKRDYSCNFSIGDTHTSGSACILCVVVRVDSGRGNR